MRRLPSPLRSLLRRFAPATPTVHEAQPDGWTLPRAHPDDSARAPTTSHRRAVAALTAALIMASAATARAHQTSLKILTIEARAAQLELALTATAPDVASALGVADRASAGELVLRPDTAPTLAGWASTSTGGAPCVRGPARAEVAADGASVVVRWRASCVRAVTAASSDATELTIELGALFALDDTQTVVVRVTGGGAQLETLVGVDDDPLRLRLVEPASSFARWLGLGLHHIAGGADHLAFLLALLMGAALTSSTAAGGRGQPRRERGQAPEPRAWHLRRLRAALLRSGGIISAFTLAHSATLAAAALGYFAVPAAWVETCIAVSIGYAAVSAWRAPDAPHRWRVALAFGLVHGLGFATALRDLLPAKEVIWPLVAFNLGVEFGQLLIVGLALPLLLGLARALGARRYRRWALPVIAVSLLALAAWWTVTRALDIVR